MGEIGVPELLIILAIVLLIFGPGRIVGVASGLGHAISSFRRSAREDNEPPKPEDMAHSNQ